VEGADLVREPGEHGDPFLLDRVPVAGDPRSGEEHIRALDRWKLRTVARHKETA
jgi:hypothetical protein